MKILLANSRFFLSGGPERYLIYSDRSARNWLMSLFVLIMALSILSDKRSPEYDDSKEKMAWTIAAISMVAIWFHYALIGLLYYNVCRVDITSLVYWSCSAAIYTEGLRRGLWAKKSSRQSALK